MIFVSHDCGGGGELQQEVALTGDFVVAGGFEARGLSGVEAPVVPVAHGAADPAAVAHPGGIGHRHPAQLSAQAVAGELRSHPDGHVEHAGCGLEPGGAGGVTQAAESDEAAAGVADRPVALVGLRGLRGVVDGPGAGVAPHGDVHAVVDGQRPDSERERQLGHGRLLPMVESRRAQYGGWARKGER